MIEKDDVVQFTENHKWRGSLGIVSEVKICQISENKTDIRYMIGVPIPERGTAFIYVMDSENAIEIVGKAVLTVVDVEDE